MVHGFVIVTKPSQDKLIWRIYMVPRCTFWLCEFRGLWNARMQSGSFANLTPGHQPAKIGFVLLSVESTPWIVKKAYPLFVFGLNTHRLDIWSGTTCIPGSLVFHNICNSTLLFGNIYICVSLFCTFSSISLVRKVDSHTLVISAI